MRRALILLVAATAFAQPPEAHPTFEAASIKLDNSGGNGSSSNGSKGQVVITNQSLKRLIERAYNVKPLQVSGPDWMENVHLDIVAKYPPDTKNEDRPLMLRALLEERFHLAVHHKTEEKPGFALVVAKGGFKLKPVANEGGSSSSSNGGRVRTWKVQRESMVQLADYVTRTLGEMVVDQTGLEGVYDFEMRYTNDDQKPDDNAGVDTAPSLFTALQETLGLRLKPEKVPVDIIVVDHVERVPVEN